MSANTTTAQPDPSDVVELEITDIAHGGVGVGRADEVVVFVRGAIPGEKVAAEITQRRSKLWRARVVDVLDASPHRVEHPWAVGAAGVTGAADFGHIDPDFQLELKTRVLADAVRRVGGADLAEHLADHDLTVVGLGEGWHTRTRFDAIKLETGIGMHLESSHDVVRIEDMPLAVSDLASLDLFGSAWDRAIEPGARLKVVAPSHGENVVVVDEDVFSAPGIGADDVVQEVVSAGGSLYDYQLAASGFWQVHAKAPSVLAELVLAGADVQPGDTVVELFAGAGLFTVPLARATGETGHVLTLEGSKRAVGDARDNVVGMPWVRARRSQIDADSIRSACKNADVVVADPPRAGLGVEAARELGESSARTVVLVSCDPAAMARDVAELTTAGLVVRGVFPRDIFPNTHHMEVVTVLSRD